MAEINVVPYIDVMLVLLVIFMITAPLLAQGVKVDLPQAPSKPMEDQDKEPLVVSVDVNGDYYVNYGENQDSPVQPNVLAARVSALLRHSPGIPVMVRGDENVPYGQVVVLMTILQNAGAPSVGLVTKAPGT